MSRSDNQGQTAGQAAINFRRATIKDKEEIFRFLRIAYPKTSRYKFPERWEWEFEKNPFRDPDKLPLWIAINEFEEIVGQIGCLVEPLKVGSELGNRLHWGVDLVVLPEYRNQKVGYNLNRLMVEEIDNIIALPMSGAYRHYLLDLGAEEVDCTIAFQKRLRLDVEEVRHKMARRFEKFGFSCWLINLIGKLKFDKLVVGIFNMVNNYRKRFLKEAKLKGMSVTEVGEFGPSWDAYWNSIADQYEVVVERSSQFLNWKFVQQPWLDYKIFLAEREGMQCGYLIVRRSLAPEDNFGVIADVFTSSNDEECINSLLAFALSWCEQQGVNIVYAASSHPIFQKWYFRHKFTKLKEVHPLFKNFDDSEEIKHDYKGLHWFFSRSDHDWDQFPYGVNW